MQGQYVAYTFYKVSPEWRRLPVEERAAGKDAFAEVVEEWASRVEHLHVYSTVGVRPDCDLFLWKITERYLDLEELGVELNATPLAGWLATPYSYVATTKASQYTAARRARKIVPRGSRRRAGSSSDSRPTSRRRRRFRAGSRSSRRWR